MKDSSKICSSLNTMLAQQDHPTMVFQNANNICLFAKDQILDDDSLLKDYVRNNAVLTIETQTF